MMPDRTLEKVSQLAEAPIEAVFTDPSYGKVRAICMWILIFSFFFFLFSDFCLLSVSVWCLLSGLKLWTTSTSSLNVERP